MKFQATEVFEKNWSAINEKLDEDSKRLRYNIILNEGSSRSSKTWSFFQIIYLYCIMNKRKRVIVLRDTAIDCRENVETEFIDWMKDPMLRAKQFEDDEITEEEYEAFINQEDLSKEIIQNKTHHTHTFIKTGSRIIFTGADSIEKIIGKANDVVWINEPYKFPEDVFNQLMQRIKGFCLLDWNPKQNHWAEKLKMRERTKYIHSTFLDNPFCPEESRNSILAYQPVSYCQIVIDGKLSEQQAQAYNTTENKLLFSDKEIRELIRCRRNEKEKTANAYLWQVYGLGQKAEKPNRIFKGWNKISLEEFLALPYNSYFGLDFGTTNPSALVEIKYNDKCFFIRKRLYKPMCEMTGNDDGNGLSNEFELLNIKKNDIIIADSADKENRKHIQRNGYNILPAKKGKDSVIAGINLINNYKIYYVEDAELENEYESYEWEIINGVNLDRPIKKDDHALDAFRYILTWLCTYLNIK